MNTEGSACKVFLIDDDPGVRRSISLVLGSAGYSCDSYGRADDLMAAGHHEGPACILLDVFLEGKTGLDVQETLTAIFPAFPVIYITGKGDIPMSVKALKQGAINFLEKPLDDTALFRAVEEALEMSRRKLMHDATAKRIRLLFDALTPREHEILRYLVKGFLNKQIALELNIAEQTVKIHRGRITSKLGVKSVAEIVHMHDMISGSSASQ